MSFYVASVKKYIFVFVKKKKLTKNVTTNEACNVQVINVRNARH